MTPAERQSLPLLDAVRAKLTLQVAEASRHAVMYSGPDTDVRLEAWREPILSALSPLLSAHDAQRARAEEALKQARHDGLEACNEWEALLNWAKDCEACSGSLIAAEDQEDLDRLRAALTVGGPEHD